MHVEAAEPTAFSEVPALELSLFDDYGDMGDFVGAFEDGIDSEYEDFDNANEQFDYPSKSTPSSPNTRKPRFEQRTTSSKTGRSSIGRSNRRPFLKKDDRRNRKRDQSDKKIDKNKPSTDR